MAGVKIFYAEMCGLCHKAMDYFRENGIDFDAFEVQWERDGWKDTSNAREMQRLCGETDFVPQIIVNGKHIAGWKNLEPMLESGEFAKLLERGKPGKYENCN